MTTRTRTTVYCTIETPVGELLLAGDGEQLQRLHLQEGKRPGTVVDHWERDERPFAPMCEQLDQYFDGERREFDFPLAPRGTEFQRRVWAALRAIPYGETRTYGELAAEIGRPAASRAVGAANGANPISIVIPCHRVIGAGGELSGYAGGIEQKRRLLGLERGS